MARVCDLFIIWYSELQSPPDFTKTGLFLFGSEELVLEQNQVKGTYRNAAVRKIEHRFEEAERMSAH